MVKAKASCPKTDSILWSRIQELELVSHPDTGVIPSHDDVTMSVILLDRLCVEILETFSMYLNRDVRGGLGPLETLDVTYNLIRYIDDVRPYLKILNSIIRFHTHRRGRSNV